MPWRMRFLVISRNSIDLSNAVPDNPDVAAGKRSGWGGSRPGAGRPRVVQEPERITVDFEKRDMEALRKLAESRGTSVADLIRRAMSRFLRERGSGSGRKTA